ncbi:Spo0E family sporulation regulatory protein-aspartic acid phosphatase [Metabacillus bambusae]|uniref:Spo0E family sporulation regulatory protein-aspartic acid phosphatase n=1 Tax=Metabacillus bambusae TaxID=2795218 RepID=A0ABS3N9V9_9BACI|nr:Spo0E family sporulation regulatory protein-aspartic acid phosphatase [Metabacillus bambusae]MBO1515022.1 Spo0E family sporulation regulatory protein-aspartic acid phosphatase [Metabacillus bambusae]
MFFSVSNVFEKKRKELNQFAKLNTPLTSEEVIHQSKQLDHFITHYQKRKISKLNIHGIKKGSTLTLKIEGELDIITSELLSSYLATNKHKWTGVQEIDIDLGELNFFDTSGIHSLILLILEVRDNNISIKKIHTTKTSFEILNLMGIPNALKEINCGNFIAV